MSGEERGGEDSSFPEHEKVLIGQNRLVNPFLPPWRAVNWGVLHSLVLRASSSCLSAESSGSTHWGKLPSGSSSWTQEVTWCSMGTWNQDGAPRFILRLGAASPPGPSVFTVTRSIHLLLQSAERTGNQKVGEQNIKDEI